MKLNRYPRFKRGPNGEKLCRGCGKPVPKGRQTWCSAECYETRCPSMVISAVFRRDKGECAICRRNAEGMSESFKRMTRRACSWNGGHGGKGLPGYYLDCNLKAKRIFEAARNAGWPGTSDRVWWEADHIVPHSEGGETILANMRTLCYPCHKHRTKKWHGERSEARQEPDQPKLLLL